jgi:hypothetical protein
MTLYHRIAHVERCEPGDWPTAAADLDTRVRGPSTEAACAGVGLRLVRIDDSAAIVLLSSTDRDAIARAWVDVVAPWLDASGLVLVESAFEGDELLHTGGDSDDVVASSDPIDDFVRRVVASSTVWGLYGKTWARSAAAGDTEALPVWSDAVAAARCISGPWAGFAPRAIALSAFREQWLVGMDEDGIVAVVSPAPADLLANELVLNNSGTIIAPADLLRRLAVST